MELSKIKLVVLDFDGVLTNNKVLLNEHGEEFVSCSRGDGIAFDALRKMQIQTIILSTEKNKVVSARANKLKVKVVHGVDNKALAIKQFADEEKFDLKKILYVGNDVNDYNAMKLCGYTACPSDSHEIIKLNSTIVLNSKGGCGVAREIVEEVFRIDFNKILYAE